ncbi:MAG: NADP-specific glutamate dehydrogenase [Planctomycetota bacterium]
MTPGSPTTPSKSEVDAAIAAFMQGLEESSPNEPEFLQAVREVADSVMPYVLARKPYRDAKILERLSEPDRILTFRVCWEDDNGEVHVNRAWRVQVCNAIGPYKGGMRFHPSVNRSVLKFLGFEQVFKNSLTGLPMGGAKGGANFDPKGKSDREVMRFCQSLMMELQRHIGEHVDVPAGDIGVGAREISYMFGFYKRIKNRFTGVITGKALNFGGSLVRTEATGYGSAFFMANMLGTRKESLEGKTCSVSGSGNVAIYCIEKLNQLGAKVVTASDSSGYIHDPQGIAAERLAFLKDLKEVRRGRISEYAEKFGCEYVEGKRPWDVPVQLAFPCATQNELDLDDAKTLTQNGCIGIAEGANMPSTPEAVHHFRESRVLFGPGKAANAGGVAVSGLEQSQNSLRLSWSRQEVETRLKDIMATIHEKCVAFGQRPDGYIDYVDGANLGGFVKVAEALLAYGIH